MTPPPTLPRVATDGEQLCWFNDHVHVHEAALKSYLRQAFPSVRDEVDDVVQESYRRLWKIRAWERLYATKAFLFKVARNVTLDLLRHNAVSPVINVGDLAALPVIGIDERVSDAGSLDEKVRLLGDALATISPRGRAVVMLRKFQGLSQKETAAALGISEKTVDEHLRRAMKRLGRHLRQRGVSNLYDQ